MSTREPIESPDTHLSQYAGYFFLNLDISFYIGCAVPQIPHDLLALQRNLSLLPTATFPAPERNLKFSTCARAQPGAVFGAKTDLLSESDITDVSRFMMAHLSAGDLQGAHSAGLAYIAWRTPRKQYATIIGSTRICDLAFSDVHPGANREPGHASWPICGVISF